MMVHPVTTAVNERLARIQKALANGTLTAQESRALREGYAYPYGVSKLSGGAPALAMGRSGAADVSEATDAYIPFTVSVLEGDRDGDLVIPMGAQLGNYQRNPVVFFGHQSLALPIGTSRAPDGSLAFFKSQDRLRAYWYPDYDDPDADFIAGKVRRGILSAASLAFVPVDAERRQPERKAMHGGSDSGMPLGWLFKLYDVTEWSVVGVGSNPGAIRDALDSEKMWISPRLQKGLGLYAAQARGSRCWSGWCPTCPPPTTTAKAHRGPVNRLATHGKAANQAQMEDSGTLRVAPAASDHIRDQINERHEQTADETGHYDAGDTDDVKAQLATAHRQFVDAMNTAMANGLIQESDLSRVRTFLDDLERVVGARTKSLERIDGLTVAREVLDAYNALVWRLRERGVVVEFN
jgi:hypothetical protein